MHSEPKLYLCSCNELFKQSITSFILDLNFNIPEKTNPIMRMTLSLRKKYKTMKTIIGSMLACLSVSVSAQTVNNVVSD